MLLVAVVRHLGFSCSNLVPFTGTFSGFNNYKLFIQYAAQTLRFLLFVEALTLTSFLHLETKTFFTFVAIYLATIKGRQWIPKGTLRRIISKSDV